MHKSITTDRVMKAVQEDDNMGFCTECGEEHYQCEPDMQAGTCETCGTETVVGAEELLIRMAAC
jgi:hypothetical protein